jgi:hypothetical protein
VTYLVTLYFTNRGDERQKLKEKLKHNSSFKIQIESHSEVPTLRQLHNNFLVSSVDVMRKIRSEVISEGSTKKLGFVAALTQVCDELNANEEFQDSKPELCGYVRKITYNPHSTVLFSPQQVRFAAKCDELYLDSTGGIVPIIMEDGKKKQVLLHVVVGRISNMSINTPVPVLEVLSTVGNVAFIMPTLMEFVSKVRIVSPNWTPELIVTDFCLAYLHSACLAVRNEGLDVYINKKFDVLLGKKNVQDKKTVLFICSGHFMHANAKYLRKYCPTAEGVKPALHAFARLIECRDKADLEQLVKIITELYANPMLDSSLAQEYVDFLVYNAPLSEEVEQAFQETTHGDFEDVEPIDEPKLQREKSKFFQYFTETLQKINKTPDPTNPYYNTVITANFQRWFTYLPLFSKVSFFGSNMGAPNQTITTGYVEKSFANFKNVFHTPQREFEPDLIKKHAVVSKNLVSEALRTGRQSKPKKRKRTSIHSTPPSPQKKTPRKPTGTPGNPHFATARWGKRTGKKLDKTKTFVPKVKEFQKGKAIAKTVVGSPPQTRSKKYKSNKQFKTSPKINKSQTPSTQQKRQKTVTIEEEEDQTFQKYLKEIRNTLKVEGNVWWKSTSQVTKLFTSPLFVHGDEDDLLCLKPACQLNCTVANALASKIYEDLVEQDSQFDLKFVMSNFVTQDIHGHFIADKRLLPNRDSFDLETGNLIMLSFMQSHCFFTHIALQSKSIQYYDPMRSHIDISDRNSYFLALSNAIDEHFGLENSNWSVNGIDCPTQSVNECVTMSLGFFRAHLTSDMTVNDVKATDSKNFRLGAVRALLTSTKQGRAFLNNCNGDAQQVLLTIEARKSQRDKQNEIELEIESLAKDKTNMFKSLPVYKMSEEIDKYTNKIVNISKRIVEETRKFHESKVKTTDQLTNDIHDEDVVQDDENNFDDNY